MYIFHRNKLCRVTDKEWQNYIVLSGGLGSSEYLRQALEEKFLDYEHPNASGLKILVSDEP